jgi:hypothetical protein
MFGELYCRVPTVRVMRDGGRGVRIINRSEFDPARHVLADEEGAPAEPQQQHETAAAPTQQPRRRGRPPKNRTL